MSVSHKYNQAFLEKNSADACEILTDILEKDFKITRFGWKEDARWRIQGAGVCANCPTSHIYYDEFLICADVAHILAAEICVCIRDVRSKQREFDTRFFYENELSNMCHAIRTPLNGIFHLSDIDTLLENKENLHSNLAHLRSACTTLVENLMDVVDYLKLKNNTLLFDKSTFDVIAALRDCIERANKHIDLNVSPNVPPMMHGDAMRIRQIFMGMLAYDVVSLIVDTSEDVDDDTHRVKFLFEVKDAAGKLSFLKNSADIILSTGATEDIQMRVAYRITYMLSLRMGGHIQVQAGHDVYYVVIVLPMRECAPNLPRISIALLGCDDFAKTITESKEYNVTVDAYSTIDDAESAAASVDAVIVADDIDVNLIKKYSATHLCETVTTVARRPIEFLRDVYRHIHGKTRLLLVEDDKINCLVMKQILKKFDFVVDIAMTGRDAIGLIEKKEYDIYLLDIRLPDISGQEVAKYIQKKGRTSTKVIGITAQLLHDHGMFDRVLYKPINIAELTEAIRG